MLWVLEYWTLHGERWVPLRTGTKDTMTKHATQIQNYRTRVVAGPDTIPVDPTVVFLSENPSVEILGPEFSGEG
jgi:hypothetical protein